jgi:oxygen-independent coproporphyrinogen-3 oxidase
VATAQPAPNDPALASLRCTDPAYPAPERLIEVLADPENAHLLAYVSEDPFGAHVFPGDVPDHPPRAFLADLDAQLADTGPIHLWAYIPTCPYRCRFCQYPVVLATGDSAAATAAKWAEANIREARLWLEQVPNLATAPVGEFNVFGGTPSLLPAPALRMLVGFYRENFHFTADTAIRFEGDPTTLTPETLALLRDLGCTKLSCGVQSFDDDVLAQSGRRHAAATCVEFVRNAQRAGFSWISVDLMYGLLDQTVDSVRRDLDVIAELGPTNVVCTKLHLKSYADTRTGVAGDKAAPWQIPAYRARLAAAGHRWPTLGEQYQMRELLTRGLESAGYVEHPTMYFSLAGRGPETWKSIMVDQDRQAPEVGIGLGGSSSCRRSEAIAQVSPREYLAALDAGRLPLGSATRFSVAAQQARAVKMALSSLQPLRDQLHRARFPGHSLFGEPWISTFRSWQRRGLAQVDPAAADIRLTAEGRILVEALINTEL